MLAWGALAGISVAMCIVVAVSSGRAPSTTPFMASGIAAAAGATVGLVVELAKRKVPIKPAVHAAIVLGVAFIAVIPGGVVKYTYGSTGSLAITVTVLPTSVAWDSPTVLTGAISLFNDGSTTVRVRPHFEMRVIDPSGFPRPLVAEGCAIQVPARPTEHDLVEIPAGGLVEWSFTIPLAWADLSSSSLQCGSVLIADHGAHHVVGTFDSHPFDAFALVPVWDNRISSEPAQLVIQ